MAKAKDERAVVGKTCSGFCIGDDIYAKETKTTVQLSRPSKSYRWAVLSGASR